jgi:hypothetical protein
MLVIPSGARNLAIEAKITPVILRDARVSGRSFAFAQDDKKENEKGLRARRR